MVPFQAHQAQAPVSLGSDARPKYPGTRLPSSVGPEQVMSSFAFPDNSPSLASSPDCPESFDSTDRTPQKSLSCWNCPVDENYSCMAGLSSSNNNPAQSREKWPLFPFVYSLLTMFSLHTMLVCRRGVTLPVYQDSTFTPTYNTQESREHGPSLTSLSLLSRRVALCQPPDFSPLYRTVLPRIGQSDLPSVFLRGLPSPQ